MALVLLSMFSRQRPHLVANKLSLLLEDGLGEKAKVRFSIAKEG